MAKQNESHQEKIDISAGLINAPDGHDDGLEAHVAQLTECPGEYANPVAPALALARS
jgi:hypothetical protein